MTKKKLINILRLIWFMQEYDHIGKIGYTYSDEDKKIIAKYGLYVNDTEVFHELADRILVEYINDDEITNRYNIIDKWYA